MITCDPRALDIYIYIYFPADIFPFSVGVIRLNKSLMDLFSPFMHYKLIGQLRPTMDHAS